LDGEAKIIIMFEVFRDKLTYRTINRKMKEPEQIHLFKSAANMAIIGFFRD
jgi:hypothetical protein